MPSSSIARLEPCVLFLISRRPSVWATSPLIASLIASPLLVFDLGNKTANYHLRFEHLLLYSACPVTHDPCSSRLFPSPPGLSTRLAPSGSRVARFFSIILISARLFSPSWSCPPYFGNIQRWNTTQTSSNRPGTDSTTSPRFIGGACSIVIKHTNWPITSPKLLCFGASSNMPASPPCFTL